MQISVTKSDKMAIKSCGRDSHGVTVCDPSLGHSLMGLGRSLDFRWMEKWLALKIEWIGSKRPIKVALVGRDATDFLAP